MQEDFQDKIKITSEMSKSDKNICDLCHATERVMRIEYPTTRFYKKPSETRPLQSKWHELWMCRSCWNKWLDAMENPTNEFEQGRFARG